MLDFLEKGIKKLSKIERKQSPSNFQLNRLSEVNKRDPDTPIQIRHIIDLLDTVSKNLAYMNQERHKLGDKYKTINIVENSCISSMVDRDGRFKSHEDWKNKLKMFPHVVIEKNRGGKTSQMDTFDRFLNRMITLKNKFVKSINEVKLSQGKRQGDLQAFPPIVSTFTWLTHTHIEKQI